MLRAGDIFWGSESTSFCAMSSSRRLSRLADRSCRLHASGVYTSYYRRCYQEVPESAIDVESQESDDLRRWQLSEVVHDSLRYSHDTPVVVAGDLNTRNAPSPLRDYLLASGSGTPVRAASAAARSRIVRR